MKCRSHGFRLARSTAWLLPLAGLLALPAAAQETGSEAWPEFDVFVKLTESSRLFVLASGTRVKEQTYSDGSLGVHLDVFTSPLFKSRLERTARRADAARNKFLQFRLGYLYSASAKGSSTSLWNTLPPSK